MIVGGENVVAYNGLVIRSMHPSMITEHERDKIKSKLYDIVTQTFGTTDPRFHQDIEHFAFGVDRVYFVYKSSRNDVSDLIGFAGFNQEGDSLIIEGMAIDKNFTGLDLGKKIHELEIERTGARKIIGFTQTPRFYALVKDIAHTVKHELISRTFGRQLHSELPQHKDPEIMNIFKPLYRDGLVARGYAIKVTGMIESSMNQMRS